MFFRGSRYETIATAELTTSDGRLVRYKRLRLIPASEGTMPYRVQQDDRLDRIAFQFYGDPEQFWRICDANLALKPEALVAEVGARLLIPLPVR